MKTNNYIIKTREELKRSIDTLELDYFEDRAVTNALNKYPKASEFIIDDLYLEITPVFECQ